METKPQVVDPGKIRAIVRIISLAHADSRLLPTERARLGTYGIAAFCDHPVRFGVLDRITPLVRALLTAAVAGVLVSAQTAQPGDRPRITGIHHVALRTSDAVAARRFYAGLLGLTAVGRPDPNRATYAVGAGQRLHVESGLAAGEDERLAHVAFMTPDVQALSAYLTKRGLQVQPTNSCTAGAIRVADPDGHTIEFAPARWPPLPAAEGSRSQALSTRLLHAGLIIRDEAAAHGFYRDVLGFSEIWRGGRKEGVTQWVNMRVPDGTDYLEYMLASAAPDRRQRGVLHHVCLVVPDIQHAWEEVARRTPEAERDALSRPNVGVNGRWQLNLYDPDGTRVELMEPFTIR